MTTLTDERLREMANHIARWTFLELIGTTQINRTAAMTIAESAGNVYARELERAITAHEAAR